LTTTPPDLNPLLLLIYAALVGTAFGAVNGVLVAYARVPSIIVTLATMALYRSFLVEYSDAKSITTNSLPAWLTDFPNLPVFSIGAMEFRAGFTASLVVVIIVHLCLTQLRPARALFAVGSNPEAADMAGIDPKRCSAIASTAPTSGNWGKASLALASDGTLWMGCKTTAVSLRASDGSAKFTPYALASAGTATLGNNSPAISPDGKNVFFVRGRLSTGTTGALLALQGVPTFGPAAAWSMADGNLRRTGSQP